MIEDLLPRRGHAFHYSWHPTHMLKVTRFSSRALDPIQDVG
jgi:hypothetical protein